MRGFPRGPSPQPSRDGSFTRSKSAAGCPLAFTSPASGRGNQSNGTALIENVPRNINAPLQPPPLASEDYPGTRSHAAAERGPPFVRAVMEHFLRRLPPKSGSRGNGVRRGWEEQRGPLWGEDDVTGCRLIRALWVDVSIWGSLKRQTLSFCSRMPFVTRSSSGLVGRAGSNLSTIQIPLLFPRPHYFTAGAIKNSFIISYLFTFMIMSMNFTFFIPLFLFNLCNFSIFSMHCICCCICEIPQYGKTKGILKRKLDINHGWISYQFHPSLISLITCGVTLPSERHWLWKKKVYI